MEYLGIYLGVTAALLIISQCMIVSNKITDKLLIQKLRVDTFFWPVFILFVAGVIVFVIIYSGIVLYWFIREKGSNLK